jgi:hypothetical protein
MDHKAWALLTLIAYRARYNDDEPNPYKLELGEALINNKAAGLTMKEYRNAKRRLQEGKQAVFRRATTGANRGTVAKLLNSDVFDINADLEGQAEGQAEGQTERTRGATKKKKEKDCSVSSLSKEKKSIEKNFECVKCHDIRLWLYDDGTCEHCWYQEHPGGTAPCKVCGREQLIDWQNGLCSRCGGKC